MSIADVPLVLPLALLGVVTFSLARNTATTVAFAVFAVALVSFVIWRGWRLGKADALKRDRQIDSPSGSDQDP